MGQRIPGPAGGPYDYNAIDPGTNSLGQSPTPGPACVLRDPSVLQRNGYVLSAWDVAQSRYAGPAIIAHTEQDFHDIIQGALPMLLAAGGVVLTTTLLGAGAGSLLGGVGAIPGAAIGFAVGTTLLEVLGLAFLGVFLTERVGDIAAALASGASMAWKSCGDPASIDRAARQMAEGVGLFYAALLQALLLYLGSALASRSLAASRAALRESTLFRSCEGLEAWINKNFARLYEKHIGKPAPGALPPLGRGLDDWAKYIQQLELRPGRDKGILWSKIGDKRATELASQRGLTSLEMLLKKNGFESAYNEAFGTASWETVRPIWKQLSEKYAQGLQGRVIAFVDDQALLNSIKQSPYKPIKDLKPGEMAMDNPMSPLITNELMEITNVMERNANISVVEIRDISKPDATIKIMTRTQVLQSKAAPLQ